MKYSVNGPGFKDFCQDVKTVLTQPENPTAKFFSGLAIFPLAVLTNLTARQLLRLLDNSIGSIDTYLYLSVVKDNLIELPNRITKSDVCFEAAFASGAEFVIHEFGQNYLLDKKLTLLLKKISPELAEVTKTTSAKVMRTFVVSILTTWLFDYQIFERKTPYWMLQSLIFNLFSGAMYQMTNSILPGTAFRLAKHEILGIR